MKPVPAAHEWSEQALFLKAKLYFQRMEDHTADDWQYSFWSSLSLELLARAALAHISPTLLADTGDWRNLAHAQGQKVTAAKFKPKSVSAMDVLLRLKELVPTFDDEIFGFCMHHANRRNAELHSGELAFANLGTSDWLPRYYSACDVLLKWMDKELEDVISQPKKARELIDAYRDATASSVKSDIKAYNKVWSNKSKVEKKKASSQAEVWATRHGGHRVECPSCKSQALLQGSPGGPMKVEMNEYKNEVIQRQEMWPSSFECIACGLRIGGLSQLSTVGLGDAFSAKYTRTLAEYVGLYTEDDLEDDYDEEPEFEPDFNEY